MSGAGILDGFTLESLIAPCDRDVFFRDHWNKRPLLESRRLPSFYEGLPTLAEIDGILAYSARGLVGSGEDGLDINAALRRLEQGAALLLEHAQQQIPEFALICRTVHADLGFRCSVSIEITMPSNRPHPSEASDEHRFVMQLDGRRDWNVTGMTGDEDIVLETGDLLYLPPGCEFQHRSTGDQSVAAHLIIRPGRWVDMTGDPALQTDIALTESLSEQLPPRWIHADRAHLIANLSRRWRQAEDMMSVEAGVAQMVRTEVHAFPLDLRGRLLETVAPIPLKPETVFAARRDLLWSLEPSGSVARLTAGILTVDLRHDLIGAVTFCLTTQRYTAADLPEEDGQAVLELLLRNRLIHRIGG